MPLRPFASIAVLLGGLALLASACKKDLPGPFKAVPADVDVVGSLDAKASLAYARQALPKFLPQSLKAEVPDVEMLAKQAMALAGVDIGRLTWVHFFGHIDGRGGAVLVEGLTAEGLRGERAGEHKGVAVYRLMGEASYAQLEGLGVAFAVEPAMLHKVIDTFTGAGKRLADSPRGEMLTGLMKQQPDMDLLRVYVLTGKLPGDGLGVPVKLDGGGVFFDLDTGAAMVMLSDKDGVDKIAQTVGMGLVALQAGLMIGGGKDMPFELDKPTKDALSGFLGKIQTAKKDGSVTISYQGDLKPLLERLAGLGLKAYEQELAAERQPPPPALKLDLPVAPPGAPTVVQ